MKSGAEGGTHKLKVLNADVNVVREETGPNGNVKALVEDDGRSIYLWLEGDEASGFGTRAVWVRNRKAAPWMMEVERLQAGRASMMPARHCLDPEGGPPLSPERIEFLWFEEGDAVALLEDGDVLAVIPPWSGEKGFAGYARDCVFEGPFADPLGTPDSNPALFSRLAKAARFWNDWDDTTFPKLQEAQLDVLEPALGRHEGFWAVQDQRWPPRSVVRFSHGGAEVLVTGGSSLRPQPKIERQLAGGEAFRRFELGLAVDRTLAGDDLRRVVSYLSGQATLPWDRYTFLAPGHTVGCSALPVGPSGTRFDAVILAADPAGAPDVHLPHFEGEHVALLWMIPITGPERAFAETAGGEALLDKLREAGIGWIHRDRAGLPL